MGTRYNLVDSSWELTDPNPDVHAMFVEFSREFFWDQLGSVSVKWSKRMTLCAGLCRYSGRGGLCEIVLSEPLLKLRPRKDLVETLLHEMIHAYLFVADGDREHDAHGPKFCSHMNRINKLTGTNITVYHSFHDEVDHYKVHWWKCDGPCQHRPPFFGVVKRSMNRKPGPHDWWFKDHQASCGGTFVKIKEPENTKKTTASKMPGKGHVLGGEPSHKIDEYFRPTSGTQPKSGSSNSDPREGSGQMVGSGSSQKISSGNRISPPSSQPKPSTSVAKSPTKGHVLGNGSSHKISDYFHSSTSSIPSSSKAVPSATYTPTSAATSSSALSKSFSTTSTAHPKFFPTNIAVIPKSSSTASAAMPKSSFTASTAFPKSSSTTSAGVANSSATSSTALPKSTSNPGNHGNVKFPKPGTSNVNGGDKQKPGGFSTNGSRQPTSSNTKENKGTSNSSSGSGSNFVRRGGTSTTQGSRTVTVITLDDDDEKPTGCPRKGGLSSCNNGVPGSQIKKPEEKSKSSGGGGFVPFSGKGYKLGDSSSSGSSFGGTPPSKKFKF